MTEGTVTFMAPEPMDLSGHARSVGRHAQPAPGREFPTQPVPVQPTAGQVAHEPAGGGRREASWFPPPAERNPDRGVASGRYPPVSPPDAYALPPEPLPEPTLWELALPDLRNQVANRLHQMNWLHAQEAWARRRKDPIGAHVLAFFYAEPPHDDPPRCELRTCTRLFLIDDEQHLPRLLYEMAGVSADLLPAGGDPRTEMANTCEPMSGQAAYLGLGVSSLDTPAGAWPDAQRAAFNDMEIPGRCWALLYDGSRMIVDRFARQDYGRVEIQSTHVLHDVSGQVQRRWRHLDDASFGPEVELTWHWLRQLHNLIIPGGGRAR